jgi:hypothetical protein
LSSTICTDSSSPKVVVVVGARVVVVGARVVVVVVGARVVVVGARVVVVVVGARVVVVGARVVVVGARVVVVVVSGTVVTSTSESEFTNKTNAEPMTKDITKIKIYLLFISAFSLYKKSNNQN